MKRNSVLKKDSNDDNLKTAADFGKAKNSKKALEKHPKKNVEKSAKVSIADTDDQQIRVEKKAEVEIEKVDCD